MSRSWFFLPISLAVAAAQAAPPAAVEIGYEVRRNGAPVADVVHRLEHDGRTYQLTETWQGRGLYSLRGSARRTSRGIVSPRGLRPLEYRDERTGRDTARAAFDWAGKTLTQQYGGEPKREPLPAHAHDRLAFLYELAFAPPRGGEVSFDIADGRGVSDHVYRVGPRERIATPAGEFRALRLTRTKEGGERADIWLALERDYLPLRILISGAKGEVTEQVATRLRSDRAAR